MSLSPRRILPLIFGALCLLVAALVATIASATPHVTKGLPAGLDVDSTSLREPYFEPGLTVGSVRQPNRGAVLAGTGPRLGTDCRYTLGGDAAFDRLERIQIGRAGNGRGFRPNARGVVPGTVESVLVGLLPTGDGGFLVVANTLSNASCDGGEGGGWSGERRLFVGRFDAGGSPVRGFGDLGSAWRDLTEASGLTRAEMVTGGLDGMLVASAPASPGGSVKLTRLKLDGEADSGFGSGGEVVLPGPTSEVVDLERRGDRHLLLTRGPDEGAPESADTLEVTRLDATGLDTAFGDGGTATISYGQRQSSEGAVGADSSGRPLVSARLFGSPGEDRDLAVARLTEEGELDDSFSSDGLMTVPGEALGSFLGPGDLTSVGRKILVPFSSRAGRYALDMPWSAVRVNENGTLDQTLGERGLLRLRGIIGSEVGLVGSSSTLDGVVDSGRRDDELGTVAGLNAEGLFR